MTTDKKTVYECKCGGAGVTHYHADDESEMITLKFRKGKGCPMPTLVWEQPTVNTIGAKTLEEIASQAQQPEVKAVQEHAVAEPVNDNPFLQTKPTFVQPTIAPTKPVEPEVPSQYGPPPGVNLNDDRTVQLARGDAKERYLKEAAEAAKHNPAEAAHLIKGINVENIALINDDKSAVMIRSTLN